MTELDSRFRFNPLSRRLFLGTCAGAVLVPGLSSVAAAATRAGEVAEIRGSAEALTGETARALAKMAEVFVNDLVRTAPQSRLSLKLGQRTTLRLGPESEIRIDKYLPDAGGEIEVASGAIGFNRTGRKSEEDLRFRNAYGLIAVRGTRFYAGPSQGKFGVLVEDGRVAVRAAGVTVMLGSGEGTDIASPGEPPSPSAKWKPARVRALIAQVH